MKKRSIIRLENFLLICGTTAGATLGALVYSWVVLPLSSIHDAYDKSKESGNVFENFPDAYNKNVVSLSQTPFVAYNMAKLRAAKRLQDFDTKKK